MRRMYASLLPLAALVSLACTSKAQNESARQVAGGGLSVKDWSGQIDPGEARRGQVLKNAKLAQDGNALHVTTGPAVAYWNPRNTASHDYTVKATFTEPKYMNLNDHPHPYGIFIGGNDMGTANQSYLYCAADAGSPVTQDIAVSVKGDRVSCAINGTVVGTYNKSDVVGPRKLKSTDGIYGIRFSHNTEGLVSGLT